MFKGYNSKYTRNLSYQLEDVPVDDENVFLGISRNVTDIKYFLSFTNESSGIEADPGNFYVGKYGGGVALPSHLGKYSGKLVARDITGAEAVVKNWTFQVLPPDTDIASNGPNGKTCFNGGIKVDPVPLDNTFTCKCLQGYKGSNCEEQVQSTDRDTKWIISIIMFLVLLTCGALVYRWRVYRLKMQAHDFRRQLEMASTIVSFASIIELMLLIIKLGAKR